MTFTPLRPGEHIRNGDYRRLKSEAGEWEKIDGVFGDCRVDPESALEYARATPLRDEVYTPDLPPGVSFDPLTGALTITEGSAVKRVVVPDGMEITVPGNGVLHSRFFKSEHLTIHRTT